MQYKPPQAWLEVSKERRMLTLTDMVSVGCSRDKHTGQVMIGKRPDDVFPI